MPGSEEEHYCCALFIEREIVRFWVRAQRASRQQEIRLTAVKPKLPSGSFPVKLPKYEAMDAAMVVG